MKTKIKNLETLINIKFKNISLLENSMIHKSFDKINNNEKLEFLGDRVLGLVIAKKLLEVYPDEKEGIIDKKFANLVNKKACAKIGLNLNLKKFMTLGDSYKGLKRSDDKILSDCLEALIGAIFLDSGLNISEKFILKYWNEYIIKSELTLIDPKTKLQEYSLKTFKKLPLYKMQKKSGPQHNPIFKVEVRIQDSKIFTASGSSKKNAEQNAAKKLISELKIR
jgi:ribonuclease III